MRSNMLFVSLVALFAGVVILQSGVGCGGVASDCKYNGKTYKEGQSFPSTDGCNTCTCSKGQAMCTLKGCVQSCNYNGKLYHQGQSFPSTDGCNTCSCGGDGKVACTQKACVKACGTRGGMTCKASEYCAFPDGQCGAADKGGSCKPKPDGCATVEDFVCGCDGKSYSNACVAAAKGVSVKSKGKCPATSCTYQGKTYKIGDKFAKGDGCNTCTCNSGGVACTDEECPKTCTYNGKTYKEGDSFPATDGCNTCTCRSGKVGCTEKACPPERCGGIAGFTCKKKGDFCQFAQGTCHYADNMGVCKTPPQNCDANYDPVCGCDNKTYSNACVAASQKMSINYKGKCKPTCTYNGKVYKEGETFPRGDGCNTCTCKSGQAMCTMKPCKQTCGSRGMPPCPTGLYCNFVGYHCGATDKPGVCEKKPQGCPENIDWVCGCDGKSYTNACEAAAKGVSVKAKGKCPTTTTCTYNGKTYKDGDTFPATDGCNTCGCKSGRVVCTLIVCKGCGIKGGMACKTGTFCEAPTGTCSFGTTGGKCTPIPSGCTKQYDPVCGCDGKTYGNTCMAQAAKVSIRHKGACKTACKTNTDCKSTHFCSLTSGTCSGSGTCVVKPQACTQQYDPVCGCDGKTHGNACSAASKGVNIKHKGACSAMKSCTYDGQVYKHGETFPATDGCNRCSCSNGLVGCTRIACGPTCKTSTDCKKDQYCQRTFGFCTAKVGNCRLKPTGCTRQYDPVCGCDGKTYSNSCVAASQGVSVKQQGKCP